MKRILLAVTGMSPQVVTETIYALHQEGNQIDEVEIITTKKGKEQAWLGLGVGTDNEKGQLARLVEDYNLPPITFNESSIKIVPDADGNLVDDARTVDDQYALADFITNRVRVLTEDNNTQIFASLAGGRKTMTFFLGYAMSLFGRKQDSLSHVLVDSDFEGVPDFFYPTPTDKMVRNRAGHAFNAKKANVQLTDIPFVRMREELPEAIINNGEAYCSTIEKMNLADEKPSLIVNYKTNTIIASGIAIDLPPAAFTFYTWFVDDSLSEGIGFPCPIENVPEEETSFINHCEGRGLYTEKIQSVLESENGISKRYFSERKTKVNSIFKSALGKRLASVYQIDKSGKYKGRNQFKISIDNENIQIETEESDIQRAIKLRAEEKNKFGI
ncbi:CRISPR-associated ring nuclease Csm6 [Psychromonas arctica]|uniref:CRISPR-associated ring nuclease Csm6 n=1 Tax=Psychromonas arctica TaxID=168275 RepID=UPI002FD4D1D1